MQIFSAAVIVLNRKQDYLDREEGEAKGCKGDKKPAKSQTRKRTSTHEKQVQKKESVCKGVQLGKNGRILRGPCGMGHSCLGPSMVSLFNSRWEGGKNILAL